MWQPWNQLSQIQTTVKTILANQVKQMAAIDTLNANVAALQAEWTKFLADLTTVLANTDSDAAVAAAADLVAQQTAAISAEDTTIQGPPAA